MSNALTQEQASAVKAYTKADSGKKKMLEGIFGKELFAPKPANAMERIKSFADACKAKKKNSKKVLPYANPQNEFEEGLNAVAMQWIICEALRGDWVPDYGNSEQEKWYCWFRWDGEGGGFVFARSLYECVATVSLVGSRLCFPTEEMADYFGTQFIAIHRKVLQYKNAA